MGPAASASNLVAVRVIRCVTRSWTAPMTAAGARTTTPAPSGLIALQHSVVGRTRTRNASRQALTARHRMECATEPPQRLRPSIRSMSRKERRMATTWSRDIESDPGQQKWHTALRARRCSESRAEHAKLVALMKLDTEWVDPEQKKGGKSGFCFRL